MTPRFIRVFGFRWVRCFAVELTESLSAARFARLASNDASVHSIAAALGCRVV